MSRGRVYFISELFKTMQILKQKLQNLWLDIHIHVTVADKTPATAL